MSYGAYMHVVNCHPFFVTSLVKLANTCLVMMRRNIIVELVEEVSVTHARAREGQCESEAGERRRSECATSATSEHQLLKDNPSRTVISGRLS